MEQNISVNYPESLASSLKMNSSEFSNEMKNISLVKLYEIGRISSTLASKVLKITRLDFLDLLQKYKVSYFANGLESELENDFANA
ncbi:MAG: hypothetical protein B6I18_02010 [Bacteroidetes bacterium 4572_112]|nr:MAG: hypothetical protein B6I18_02010 [Bacteroidetes bacterium 4572_112]